MDMAKTHYDGSKGTYVWDDTGDVADASRYGGQSQTPTQSPLQIDVNKGSYTTAASSPSAEAPGTPAPMGAGGASAPVGGLMAAAPSSGTGSAPQQGSSMPEQPLDVAAISGSTKLRDGIGTRNPPSMMAALTGLRNYY